MDLQAQLSVAKNTSKPPSSPNQLSSTAHDHQDREEGKVIVARKNEHRRAPTDSTPPSTRSSNLSPCPKPLKFENSSFQREGKQSF